MLTRVESGRLRQLEEKPIGSLTPAEEAELAYLRHKRGGERTEFVDRDETMPDSPGTSSDDIAAIERETDMP